MRYLQASQWSLLFRLAPTIPVGMWPSLASFLKSLERQKAAFFKAHGPFLYILAISSPVGEGPSSAATTLLEAICKAGDAAQKQVYIEARVSQRAWLRANGFYDIMGYKPRKQGAPTLHILARAPLPPPQRRSPQRRRGSQAVG